MNQLKISSFWERITQQIHSLWKSKSIRKATFKYICWQSLNGGIPLILIWKEYPPPRKLFMLKGKSCTHHISSSLDLQGIEALMTCLLTEVGKMLMDASNRTKKNPKQTHTKIQTHLFTSTLHTSLFMFQLKRTDVEKGSLIHVF